MKSIINLDKAIKISMQVGTETNESIIIIVGLMLQIAVVFTHSQCS